MTAPATVATFGLGWRAALVRAALTVWLPTLVPIVAGMLSGCGHCASTYGRMLPIVPGVLVPVVAGLEHTAFVVVGAVVALALFALTALLLRELPRRLGYFAQGVVALAVAGEAIALAVAMRA